MTISTAMRLSLALRVSTLIWLALSSAHAAARPSLLDPGPYAIDVMDYRAGAVSIQLHRALPDAKPIPPFNARLEGRLYLPAGEASLGAEPFPVVVIIPARHATCQSASGEESTPIRGEDNSASFCDDDPKAGTSSIHAERGYDYFARALASYGIAVVAVGTNDIQSVDGLAADAGDSAGRLRIAFAHLDALRRYSNGLVAAAPIGDKLIGKLDFTRIGFVGHSRGGAALGNILRDNAALKGFRYSIKAVLMIAAGGSMKAFGPDGTVLADGDDNFMRLQGVAIAGISGDCDGDGSDVGFGIFARSKYGDQDPYPKYYWRVAGANHNFFNQLFTTDDADKSYGAPGPSFSAACNSKAVGSLRLSRPDQQRIARGYITAFFRRFLLSENALDDFLSGVTPFPTELCPQTSGRPCSEIVNTSYIPPSGNRRILIAPDERSLITDSPDGETVRGEGFDYLDWCEPFGRVPKNFKADGFPANDGQVVSAYLAPFAKRNCRTAPPGYAPASLETKNSYLQSTDRQLELVWRGPSTLSVKLGQSQRDISAYGALRLRVFADYLNDATPQPDRTSPVNAPAVKVDFSIALVDESGRTARVRAGAFSESALTVPFRPKPVEGTSGNLIKLTLGGLRIPLSAFRGVNLSQIASIRFEFGGESARTGAIHLADVLLDKDP